MQHHPSPLPLFRLYEHPFPTYVLGTYTNDFRETVLNFKLHQRIQAIWQVLLKHQAQLQKQLSDIDILVPIPNSPLRIFHYGFYPTLALAELLSKLLHKPILDRCLSMKRGLKQLKTFESESTKIQYLRKWLRPGPRLPLLSGKSVLLIDDVMNTGSTLQVASKLLLAETTCDLTGFVLAYAQRRHHHVYPVTPWKVPEDLAKHNPFLERLRNNLQKNSSSVLRLP